MSSCKNPKSRFETAGPIPPENEGKVADLAPYGTIVNTNLNFGGISLTNSGSSGAFVAKYSSSGATQWALQAGGTNFGDYFDVALDGQSNVYPAGSLSSDAAVAKYNPAGMLQWTYSAGGPPATPVASIVAKCAVDSAGNCYLAGWYQGTATFGTNVMQPKGAWNFSCVAQFVGNRGVDFM